MYEIAKYYIYFLCRGIKTQQKSELFIPFMHCIE